LLRPGLAQRLLRSSPRSWSTLPRAGLLTETLPVDRRLGIIIGRRDAAGQGFRLAQGLSLDEIVKKNGTVFLVLALKIPA